MMGSGLFWALHVVAPTMGIALALAKASAVVLTALVAFALLGYLKRAALHRRWGCTLLKLPTPKQSLGVALL